MKEQFDKRLVEKIKGSFENYEEPFDPKEWEKFSNVYFNKNKPKPIWAWVALISGVAASLIIGLLFWPVMVDISKEEYVSHDREIRVPEQESRDSDKTTYEKDKIEGIIPEDTETETNFTTKELPSLNIKKDHSISRETTPYINQDFREDGQIISTEPTLGHTLDKTEAIAQKYSGLTDIIQREAAVASLQLNLNTYKEPLKEEEAQKIINTWAMADMPVSQDKKKGEPVKWGLVMAPQAASNTTMGLNLGGGVMSEISLSKRLKLDVGVTFARQSLVPGQGQNVAMVMNSSPGGAIADQLQNAAGFGQSRGAILLGSNMVMPVSPTYELNFANLDIPINLKYKVMDNPQSGLYLISGLSSMIYLSQSSSETYNISYIGINQANAFSASPVQTLTTEITPQDGESSIDLGRMLNLSFGYEYKLSGGTFLSVEPFYKLPIGNMTFVDQQFSIGGVNLRMNFQFKK